MIRWQCKHIPDDLVVALAANPKGRGRLSEAIAARLGCPVKVAYRKIERLVARGLLDYGVSPDWAWPLRKEGQA